MADEVNPNDEAVLSDKEPSPTTKVNLVGNKPEAAPQSPNSPAQPAEVPSVNQPLSEPGKLRSIGQLFKDSFAVFKKAWVKYLLFLLLIGGVVLGVAGIAALAGFVGVSLWETSWVIPVILLIIGIVAVVYLVISLSLSLNKLIYSYADGVPEGINSSLKYGFKNSISFFAISILSGLIVMAALIIGGIITGIMIATAGLNLVTIIVAVLLIVPAIVVAIYLGTMLSFVTQNFVAEGNRGMAAIKRSWSLVKGSFWKVFLRALIIGLVSTVISLLNQGFDNAVFALITIASYVLQFVYSLIAVIYSYLIYKDLSTK